jgi:hypothetical protein
MERLRPQLSGRARVAVHGVNPRISVSSDDASKTDLVCCTEPALQSGVSVSESGFKRAAVGQIGAPVCP